eukprot:CAMPEP_0197486640 /NCGR_PEP_ID=MMETSP1311-20131121/1611_1 /TAXON_ID=464262 /ORGANISM="Genus nov. species nov., Strain RCC856" /LENGTH=431 /DNA_ID=CAMNT_0043029849 /DNA_START=141 /DNA_END=1439 /DNA_ORIENTATION=+
MGNVPSFGVSIARLVAALALSPLAAVAGAATLFVSCPLQLWRAIGLEQKRKILALLLMPVGAALSLPLGALCGVVFALLWALYGSGAPENPFSLERAGKTRHEIPAIAEVEALELKAQHKDTLAFGALDFKTSEGDKELHCHTVKPHKRVAPNDYHGVVIVQHGLHCHGGAARTLKVAARFAEEGYAAYLPDLANHGRSSGSWAVVSSLEDLASDLAFLTREVSRLHPNLPVLLQGESLGGLLVLYAPQFMTTDTLDRLSGVVAVCPALRLAEDVEDPILDQFIQLWPMDSLKKVFPKFPATPGTQGTIFSEVPELRQAAQASIEADPLEYSGMVKMATGLTFLQSLLIEKTRKKLVAKIQTLKKPLLILHGTSDKCVDVSCSRELFEGAQSRDKTLKEYEGKAHVLLSEDEETRERFLGDMTDWIKTHSL